MTFDFFVTVLMLVVVFTAFAFTGLIAAASPSRELPPPTRKAAIHRIATNSLVFLLAFTAYNLILHPDAFWEHQKALIVVAAGFVAVQFVFDWALRRPRKARRGA